MFWQFALVALGSALGGCVRYAIYLALPALPVWKLLCVNVFGSFLFGLFYQKSSIYLFFMVGFLGSFTTFSTLSYEMMMLVQRREICFAMLYLGLSFILAFGGFALGAWIYQKVF